MPSQFWKWNVPNTLSLLRIALVPCADSVCTECGNIIEQSTPIGDMKCD